VSDAARNENAKPEVVRILLVEDDDGSARVLQTVLSYWRYGVFEIRRVGSLSAALQEAARGGMDLVLLDLGLPDSLGLETFVRMRAASALVPIIVLTGLEDEELANATLQQGAQDYIIKGQADGASLARSIRYAIERCRVQHELVDKNELLHIVIDSIPNQVYLKDAGGRFVAVNAAVTRFFGASAPAQIIGKTDFDYFPRELAEQFLAEEQSLLCRNQPCVNREAGVTDSSGNTRWVLTTKVPLQDHAGRITGLLGINFDITDRKAVEERINLLNAELEKRVAERTVKLRDAMARLEEHDRTMAEFVSSVSHELRTPLTSMKFAIENILDGVVGLVPEPVNEYLRMLEADCQRMANTVEDILDLSRLESRTMRLNRVKNSFDRLILRSAMALKAQAQAKNIETVMSIGRGLGFVDCDAPKMVRAIINIIGNAIKFTPDGGRVEICLRRQVSTPDILILEIMDNGIGIPRQHLARVAEKYFRVSEHLNGTGLGLSIAREIVEIHGGRLTVQSPPPERELGTMVSISMPTVDPPTILVANADETARELLLKQLRASAYNVIVCSTPEEALVLARGTRPDAGIFEVSPPVIGEENPIFLMKTDQDLRTIPIVVIAIGVVTADHQARLKRMGIPVLPKPWREEDLLDRVETAISGISSSNMPTK